MQQLTIEHAIAARALAEAGMARTLNAERDGWLEQAIKSLRIFAALPGHEQFKMEDFRWWYADAGLPQPHDHHCWGAFTNRARQAGAIEDTGRFATSKSPKTHGHMVRVWRAGP